MTIFHAFLLGIIQGLTEFIPVSSTAHLLIGQQLLDIPASDAVFSFLIIIQLGTTLALILYYLTDILKIVRAFVNGLINWRPFETFNARMGWLVLLATFPALVIGFLLRNILETVFSNPLQQAAVRLLMSALLLTTVERLGKHTRTLETVNWGDALTVGLFQVLAIFPGASRSGSTMAGAIIRGLDRPSAARFAFLISAPILLAAGGYESLNVVEMTGTRAFLPYLAVGFITAAIVGWMAIKWLISYLSKHSLYVFAVYCAILGTIVAMLAFI